MAVPLTLKVYKGEELIASKDYDRDLIKIGRLSSAHLCLEDEKVSRIHAVIDVGQDGAMFVTDMGSVEGTYVNGKRVTKSPLTFGDEIKVGNTTIQVHETAANLAQAAQEGELPAPDEQPMADPAEALGHAAAAAPDPVPVPAPVAAAAPAPTRARTPPPAPPPPPVEEEEAPAPADESFARTEENNVVPGGAAQVRSAGAAPARARPARRQGTGPLGLELRLSWGDHRVAEHFLLPGEPRAFTVGSAASCNFIMGDGKLGSPSFEAATVEKEGFSIHFTKRMGGELTRGQESFELLHLIEGGKAQSDGDGYSVHLTQDDYIWVDLGGITLEAFLQPVPKRVLVPISETLDFTVLNIFLVLFFVGALFVITAMNRSLEGDEYADELSSSEARIAKLIIKPPEKVKNPFLEKLAQQKEKQSGEMSAKHRGDEGEAGRKDAPNKRNAHMAPQGKPNEKDQARMLTNRIFGGKGGGLSTVFGSNGLGGELTAAMGGLFGASAGDSKGFGGLGLRGTGGGGGGVGDTIGIGAIGTKGRGGGTGTYGNGVGVLGGKRVSDIGITSSDPEVMGSLDKELIRQVIRSHRDQIRYCYETQLARFPNLKGKVAVKFVISAVGSVASSSVAQSTVGNGELDSCVAGRVRTWIFPKPKGGGVVVVTYPFLFQQAGQ